VESRDGNIYCGNCQDFIYDETLDVLRVQKGTHMALFYHRGQRWLTACRQEAKVRRHYHDRRPQARHKQLDLSPLPSDRPARALQYGPDVLHERHPTNPRP
jgi:hypothetical protein